MGDHWFDLILNAFSDLGQDLFYSSADTPNSLSVPFGLLALQGWPWRTNDARTFDGIKVGW
jgi:hypothetical protein